MRSQLVEIWLILVDISVTALSIGLEIHKRLRARKK